MEIPNKLFSMDVTRLRYLLAVTILMLVTFPVHANVLLPGDTNVAPDVFANPGSPPVLNITSGTFSFGSGIGLLTGSYFEAVLVDPLGVTCTGCLDFAFQVSEDGGLSSGIFSMILGGFNGYTTDVGYISGTGNTGAGPGNGDPLEVSRGIYPLVGVVFTFSVPGNTNHTLGPGSSSDILVVATNATTYDDLGLLLINGGGAASPANGGISDLFAPTLIPVPEPSTALLLSLGLVGIAAFRKRTS